MRKISQKLVSMLLLLTMLVLTLPQVALADTMSANDVGTGGDASKTPGQTGMASFYLQPQDGADPVGGCNATGDTPARVDVTSSDTSKVTINSLGYIGLVGCGAETAQTIGYTVLSTATGGTVTISGTASGGKSRSTYQNDSFTVTITATADTTKPLVSATATRGTATPPAAYSFGTWSNVTPVDVTISASDAVGLNSISYSINGGAAVTTLVSGTSASVPVSFSTNGTHTLSYTAKDGAGNVSDAGSATIKIDTAKPTLSSAATTEPNAAGWYNGDVTIQWTAQDQVGLSGIDATTAPADSVLKGEGSSLGAGPVTVQDRAGNVSDPARVTGIKIDRGQPTISGTVVNDDGSARSANAAEWFNSAVRVRFGCADPNLADGTPGSGISPTCVSDVVLATDGANQAATSGAASDNAGNPATRATVSGINIDSQAPQTTATNQCDGRNGWCKGQTATVVLTAADPQGLSGVKEIRYTVNGGQEKVATGASASVNVPLAAKSGLATVEFYAVDNAGNVEAKGGVSLKYDNIAPTVTHTVNPDANADGWNNATVTVHFTAKDDDGGSGVDVTSVTGDVTVSAETAATGQVVKGEAYDLAGNKGTDSVTVKLDKTAPTISGAIVSGTKGANGWYTGPVMVRFTCSDALSDIATCPADVVLNVGGADQSATGKAVDKAGNEASSTVGGISIDSTKPGIAIKGIANGGVYTLGAVPAASCEATDALSGVDANGCRVSVTGGTANGVGTFTYTATATDNAGNTATETGSYTVAYSWAGFLQPINDTAHQVGTSTSIFKAGSTVPAKFQLKDANGNVVQASSAPAWLSPAMGSATSAPVDETASSASATSGSYYKWDSTSQQYVYNWGTAKNQAGYYWRIGVKLDDGQTYYVNIGLR